MTSSNGNIFRVTGLLCGKFTGHRWIPHRKADDVELECFLLSTSEPRVEWRGAWVFFFYLRLNQQLTKQWRRPWFETSSRSLWRHHNGLRKLIHMNATWSVSTSSWVKVRAWCRSAISFLTAKQPRTMHANKSDGYNTNRWYKHHKPNHYKAVYVFYGTTLLELDHLSGLPRGGWVGLVTGNINLLVLIGFRRGSRGNSTGAEVMLSSLLVCELVCSFVCLSVC